MSSEPFETAIPAIKPLVTYALDRTANRIGNFIVQGEKFKSNTGATILNGNYYVDFLAFKINMQLLITNKLLGTDRPVG
jgi:hypothetical protein